MIETSPHHPLHRFRLVCSGNPDDLSRTLADVHHARNIDFGSDLHGFHSISALLPLRNVDLIFGACTAPVNMTLPESGMVKQKIALHGSASTSFAGMRI